MEHHTSSFIAYLRVSTTRQGTTGVSLSEQRLAIEQYAAIHALRVSRWLTETQSAAGRRRPVFEQVLDLLRKHRAAGVLIHRIDRGARNLYDWAKIGELIDLGADVRFVHDGLDLHSRGGRLAADIQAVVAADFVRNLREETMKGMRGRFRQGLYPMAAPLAYLDRGRARPKALDPERAPLLRHAFERYASGHYTLRTLRLEMHMAGLRNRHGRPVSINGWSRILNNPFYAGQLRLRRTGEVFAGLHEPLISLELFERVQEGLRRRSTRQARVRHHFTFRRQLLCTRCGRCVVGERKKGRVYYRCHNRSCPGVCVRTDRVDAALLSGVLTKNPDPAPCIRVRIPAWGVPKIAGLEFAAPTEKPLVERLFGNDPSRDEGHNWRPF